MKFVTAVFLVALSVVCRPLPAAEFPFSPPPPGLEAEGYSDAIPEPQAVLGHRVGARHTEPHQVVDYFRAVAESSDRVVVEQHGRSYEGRRLIHAIVTAPDNHDRLESIREANRRISEMPEEVDADALAEQPLVALMGYSIHGDEASGSEAAVLLLYHLAAGRGPAVEDLLGDTVVIIDPLFNPDGRHRFTTWVNQNRGGTPVADPQDREHDQPWPGGRTNHYWFDLNRDWLPAQHPESRARLEVFHAWRPQILTDFHEMGSQSNYFFQPGVPDRVNPQTPRTNQQLTAEMGRYHAEALDRLGSLYFTRETFDDFYPGKGSTYPDLNGALGILFEQASSRSLRRDTENGLLTYRRTIANQFATSLSTLKAAVDMRGRLLKHQRDFYAAASGLADQGRVSGYVLGGASAPVRTELLVRLLRRHRIRVHELARDVERDGVKFRSGEAYLVPTDQPQTRLLSAMMERRTDFESSIFYDVSTWTFPRAFGVPTARLTGAVSDYLGAAVEQVDLDEGRLIGGRAEYAYLIPWGRFFAPRALYRLQKAGIRTRVLTRPFSIRDGEHSLPRGTILVTVRQNPDAEGTKAPSADRIHEVIRQSVNEDHITAFAVDSGLTPQGPDLGSRRYAHVLDKPEVALVTGRGARAYNAGEVWHLLSERFEIPVSLLDIEDVSRRSLERYNTLVLAGGSYDRLDAEAVKDWIASGGRLIAITTAVDWAVNQELASLEKKEFPLEDLLQDRPYDELADVRQRHRIPGTIFRARLDTSHPIGFGYGEWVDLLRTRSDFYRPSGQPGNDVAVYDADPLVSGYVSQQRLKQAPGSAAIVARSHGAGSVILFMDNPNFRAFWYGTNGLFLNTVFFGGLL